MAATDEFKIKGAAIETADTAPASPPRDNKQSNESADSISDSAEEAEESKQDLEDGELNEQPLSQEEMLAKYRFFKCQADAAVYGPDQYYYIHADTQESRWTEPEEPFWIYDPATGLADTVAGLQYPIETKAASEEPQQESSKTDEPYMGYNPKIHGNYDPNADYAQWHNKKREEEAIAADPYRHLAPGAAPGTTAYESIMTLNRFTGNAQTAGLDPERHSDAAKSARQMSAFFDVDAAANAHEGRSLKAERKSQKLTKEEVKAFNQARADKKRKRRMQFLTS